MKGIWIGALMAAVAGAALPVGAQSVQGRGQVASGTSTALESYVKVELRRALDAFQADGDAEKAERQVRGVFEAVIARGNEKQLELFRDTDFTLRMVRQLAALPADKRKEMLGYFRAHDGVARSMVFFVTDEDPVLQIYTLFDRFRKERGAQLDTFPNLVAALCVVHCKPFERRINEVTTRSADPVALFDYFAGNEKSMAFGVRAMPPELMMYVVDTTASVPEMQWALARYKGDANVGRHFFDVSYDREYLESGKGKKISKVAYVLPNILQYGGVCADQAYFAMAIGKAIGVPTAYARGASGEVGHAWVGFLQAQGPRGAWNFDTGRYDEFRGVRGLVEDPHTRTDVPDAFVSFSAELISAKPVDRQSAEALSDAAAHLFEQDKGAGNGAAKLPADVATLPVLREPGDQAVSGELALLKLSLKQNAGNADAWFMVAALASKGALTYEQKTQWSDDLLKQCGQRYPDFAVAVVTPMIETVEDAERQNTLWNGAFERFKGRFDLAAFIRMKQAALWEKQKDYVKAGKCYTDVIERYANAGPFVLQALAGAEGVLRQAGKPERVPTLYVETWKRCQKPADMGSQFMRQSNWYRVGTMLANKLVDARQPQQAAMVRAELQAVMVAK